MTALAQVAIAPFDAAAASYDQAFTESCIGRAQRAAVWKELEHTFHPGDHLLEIGCGTGVDACYLAGRGVRVSACDSSPAMIEVARERVAREHRQDAVALRVLAAEEVSHLRDQAPFDGAFSNFGALNCVHDLAFVAESLGALLKPNAALLVCLLGPSCAWEFLWYAAQGKLRKAARRLHRSGVTARISGGPPIQVYYPGVQSVERAFAPAFRLRAVKGIGIAVPPSYLEPWAQRSPGFMKFATHADEYLSHCPGIRLLGDHVLLKFTRNGSGPAK